MRGKKEKPHNLSESLSPLNYPILMSRITYLYVSSSFVLWEMPETYGGIDLP